MFSLEVRKNGKVLTPNKQGKFVINSVSYTALQLYRTAVFGITVSKVATPQTKIVNIHKGVKVCTQKKVSKPKVLISGKGLIGMSKSNIIINKPPEKRG